MDSELQGSTGLLLQVYFCSSDVEESMSPFANISVIM